MTVNEAISILENMNAENWNKVSEAITVLIDYAKTNSKDKEV